MSELKTFDESEALDRVEKDEELLRELLELFLENVLPEKRLELEECKDEPERLRGAAHSLKGSLLNLSAHKGADLAFRLEKGAANADREIMESLLEELKRELSEIEEVFKSYLKAS